LFTHNKTNEFTQTRLHCKQMLDVFSEVLQRKEVHMWIYHTIYGVLGFGWLCIRCQYDCSARPDPDLLEVTHQTYNLSLFYIQQLYQMISFLSLSGI